MLGFLKNGRKWEIVLKIVKNDEKCDEIVVTVERWKEKIDLCVKVNEKFTIFFWRKNARKIVQMQQKI